VQLRTECEELDELVGEVGMGREEGQAVGRITPPDSRGTTRQVSPLQGVGVPLELPTPPDRVADTHETGDAGQDKGRGFRHSGRVEKVCTEPRPGVAIRYTRKGKVAALGIPVLNDVDGRSKASGAPLTGL
jgi:hypothetical protein